MSSDSGLVLEAERIGSKFRVTAKLDGEPVHMDSIDLANASRRQRFCKTLQKKVPQAEPDEVDAELVRLASAEAAKETAPIGGDELDVSSIVRPELFHAAEVSGIAVPVVVRMGGEAVPKWLWHLRWADGRREVRDVEARLALPDGRHLWVHPEPAAPPMGSPAQWSRPARQQWLASREAPSASRIFRDLCVLINDHVEFPPEAAQGTTATLALWVMLTYVYRAWSAVPYLYVGGPLGSGKSRLFEVLGQAVFRPMSTSNVTGPALFRTLHGQGGTVLADEAERLKGREPDVKELLSMFLAGYKRGGTATRLEPVGDTYRTVHFDVYTPKALACIAGLPTTLLSRCIRITMCRAASGSEKTRRRIDASGAAWQQARDELHALALAHGPRWSALASDNSVVPAAISNRNRELWQPLLALAAFVEEEGAEGLLNLVQGHAQDTAETASQEQAPEADEAVLEALASLVLAGSAPTSGQILERARQADPSLLDNWVPNTVTQRLGNYGLATPKKVGGKRAYRSVLPTLLRIQERYGLDLGIDASKAASHKEDRAVG